MNKVKPILLIILIFIFLNMVIVFLWPLKTKLKFNNYQPYSNEFINSLNLNTEEALELYLETWQREPLLVYDEFTGVRESDAIEGKYVNISKKNGRLIPNNLKMCNRNIFFYGGEVVFGYDVTDAQTIPYYFSKIFNNYNLKYCVFNFGRKTYNSTQENILLQKHIIQNKIKEGDIIIFLNGNNEKGNLKLLNTDFIEKNYNALHRRYWKMYKEGIKYFIQLLPVTQLIAVLSNKIKISSKIDTNSKVSTTDFSDITSVYNKNLKVRKAICQEYNLQCYNFLFFINKGNKLKYNELKKSQYVYDLTNFENKLIKKNKYNSPSPDTNNLIAKEIYKRIVN